MRHQSSHPCSVRRLGVRQLRLDRHSLHSCLHGTSLYIAVYTVHLASCMLCPYSHMSFFAQLFYFAMRPFDGPVKAAQVQPAATDSNCPSQALTSQPGVIAAIVLASCALAVSCALAYRALRRPSPAKSLTLTSPMMQ